MQPLYGLQVTRSLVQLLAVVAENSRIPYHSSQLISWCWHDEQFRFCAPPQTVQVAVPPRSDVRHLRGYRETPLGNGIPFETLVKYLFPALISNPQLSNKVWLVTLPRHSVLHGNMRMAYTSTYTIANFGQVLKVQVFVVVFLGMDLPFGQLRQ